MNKSVYVELFGRVIETVPEDSGAAGVRIAKVRARKIEAAAKFLNSVMLRKCTEELNDDTAIGKFYRNISKQK